MWCARLLAASLMLLGAGHGVAADAPKTGSFDLTFTERSSLTEIKALAKRLKLPAAVAGKAIDYDLSKEHFLVYVPAGFDAPGKKPLGLIVLAIYKHAEGLPQQILPELDAANMAMIVPEEYLDSWYQRAGVGVDAAVNMRKLYPIDGRRVYVFGGGDWPDKDGSETMVASRVGLAFPEVFAGSFTIRPYTYRPVKAENGGTYPPQMPMPEPTQLTMDKQRPFVVGMEQDDPQVKLFFASYKTDGFLHTEMLPVTQEQQHYPNFQTGWIPDVLKFMDAATEKLKLPVAGSQPKKP